jgi:prevent-host-death family protein
MNTINASEFKAKCLSLLDEVARTGRTLTILKRGKAVAQLVPAVPREEGYPQLSLKGTVRITGDVVSPAVPPEEWEAEKRPK